MKKNDDEKYKGWYKKIMDEEKEGEIKEMMMIWKLQREAGKDRKRNLYKDEKKKKCVKEGEEIYKRRINVYKEKKKAIKGEEEMCTRRKKCVKGEEQQQT